MFFPTFQDAVPGRVYHHGRHARGAHALIRGSKRRVSIDINIDLGVGVVLLLFFLFCWLVWVVKVSPLVCLGTCWFVLCIASHEYQGLMSLTRILLVFSSLFALRSDSNQLLFNLLYISSTLPQAFSVGFPFGPNLFYFRFVRFASVERNLSVCFLSTSCTFNCIDFVLLF